MAAVRLLVLVAFAWLNRVKGSPERRTKYGCEGTMLDIECEEGTVISLVRANYGRFSISICNDLGNTSWSTHCIQPTTLRALTTRCGSRQRCSIDVTSAIFGDPCPATHKYMEVHYTCQPSAAANAAITTADSHAQPPWLLDLSATPPPTPKRKPTATTTAITSTTTLPTTTTTASQSTSSVQQPDYPGESINRAEEREVTGEDNNNDATFYSNRLLVLESIVDHCPPVNARGLFWNWTRAADTAIQPCPGGSSGFAKWRCGTASARSSSSEEQSVSWSTVMPDLGECESHWLSRLKTRLRDQGNTEESEDDIAAELSEQCRTRTLYGGDIARVADVMQALVHRARQQQQMASDAEKERRAADLSRRLLEAGSHLLADGPTAAAWADLVPAERAAAGSDLVAGLTEAAALQADSLASERTVAVRQANVVAAMRAMRVNALLADQRFRTSDEAVELVVDADALAASAENGAVRLMFFYYHNLDHVLPSSTNGVRFLNSQVAGATLSHQHHRVLQGRSHQPSEGGKQQQAAVTATFRHIEDMVVPGAASAASCVWWDFVGRAWAETGCWVAAGNRSHTVCQCDHMAAIMAVLTADDSDGVLAAPHDGLDNDGNSKGSTTTMTVVVAAVVSVVICIVTVAATLVIFRRFAAAKGNGSSMWCRRNNGNSRNRHHHHLHHHHTNRRRSWLCMGSGGDDDDQHVSGDSGANCGGYYPYLSSSTTTTTLTPGTPGSSDPTAVGNGQFAGECQVLRPLMITPLVSGGVQHPSGATTIYRATFANGQQAHVIPILGGGGGAHTLGGPAATGSKNFRPITPSASHIYMEIDPVYNTNSETLSDILVSDLSDDDLRRSAANGGNCSSTTTSSSSGDDSQSSMAGVLRRFDGRNYFRPPPQQQNSGLPCGDPQQQQQLAFGDYDNTSKHVMMIGGGVVDPLPLTAAAYGGQHLLQLDIGNSSNVSQQQQLMYPHHQARTFHNHSSFGAPQQQQPQQLSWQQLNHNRQQYHNSSHHSLNFQ